MADWKFRVDDTLRNIFDDDKIDVMITSERECDVGAFQTLVGRIKNEDGSYSYATASWDPVAGQMVAGKWFHRGRTARAFRYVAQWSRGRR